MGHSSPASYGIGSFFKTSLLIENLETNIFKLFIQCLHNDRPELVKRSTTKMLLTLSYTVLQHMYRIFILSMYTLNVIGMAMLKLFFNTK